MTANKVEADTIFAFLVDALRSGTKPVVLEAELEAAICFATDMKRKGAWPDAVNLEELKAAKREWWMS